jgi:CRISPR-associated endonuclease Csn1
MSLTLGLDIGSKSIGWALVDEEKKCIVRIGTRVFPEGVGRTQQGTEESKNVSRRGARSMRRQIARRALRKKKLDLLLTQHGILPEIGPKKILLFQQDPYFLRKKGLDNPLTLWEFGRVLVHICQRRGFKSNRKENTKVQKENSEMLAAISNLENDIQNSGSRTLGEYLANQLISNPLDPIRGVHTRRNMLESEFDLLWNKQAPFHPELSPIIREEIRNRVIFFQRAMYWQESTIGRCELEPSHPRAPLKDRAAQRCRMLQEINNLRVIQPDGEIRTLSIKERDLILEYLGGSDKRDFDAIRNKLKLPEHKFNLENGERKSLQGMPIDVEMSSKSFFGKSWRDKSEIEKTEIVRELIRYDLLIAKKEVGDEKQKAILKEKKILREKDLLAKAAQIWNLPKENFVSLTCFDSGSGRASYSTKALDKLLPWLETGLSMIGEDGKDSAFFKAGYLRPDQKVIGQKENLPLPPKEINNPIVRQALHEVRKLVNAIIKDHGKPDAIHVELARQTKGNQFQREAIIRVNRENEAERAKAAKEIEISGIKPGRGNIELFRLWKEQGERCIYSGKPISQVQLLGGEVNIDHVWPYALSLDDSRLNKVVCFRNENSAKKAMTPREWLEKTFPEKWEQVLQRVRELPIGIAAKKMERFMAEGVKLDDFIAKELTDTSYITRQVASYLRCLGIDIVCSKGRTTGELRHQWGLNTILNPNKENQKSREDHRHHAVDALVIALTTRSRLQKLAKRRWDTEIERPWEHFRTEAEKKITAIWVSHRPKRRVRGQLHEETIYGASAKMFPNGDIRPWSKGWIEKEGVFVYRKPLETLTLNMVENIRDIRLKEIVEERLKAHGIDLNGKGKIDKRVWEKPLYLYPRNGDSEKGALIKTVRLLKTEGSVVPMRRGNQKVFVKPGKTHHICIFEIVDEKGKKKRVLETITLLEAYRRKKNREPIFQMTSKEHPSARFIMSLCPGDLVLIESGTTPELFRYNTSASTQGQIYFFKHSEARKSTEAEKFTKYASNLIAKKVTVDILGNLRSAGD